MKSTKICAIPKFHALRYLAVQASVQQKLKQVDYMGMTTDM